VNKVRTNEKEIKQRDENRNRLPENRANRLRRKGLIKEKGFEFRVSVYEHKIKCIPWTIESGLKIDSDCFCPYSVSATTIMPK